MYIYKSIDFEDDGQNTALGEKATFAPEILNIHPVTTIQVEQDKCKGRSVRQAEETCLLA